MLELSPRTVSDDINSIEELIAFLVRENVREYNSRTTDAAFFHYLSKQELDDGAYIGKIGFGGRNNENAQNEDEAVNNALQCFKDGIYRMVINENEMTPDSPFTLKEGYVVTFIRLVMLAGRLW